MTNFVLRLNNIKCCFKAINIVGFEAGLITPIPPVAAELKITEVMAETTVRDKKMNNFI